MADPRDKPANENPGRGAEPERWPSVRQDDAVERTGRARQVTGESRSFDPSAEATTPDGEPSAEAGAAVKPEGFEGPRGDPAEGKR